MRHPTQIERLYIDFDSFFASAEQQLRPELRGRPVGVVPIVSAHTCVIAASREAKRFGVKTGTSVADAKRLCPDIAFTHARHDVYVAVHKAIKREVHRHAPIDGVCSIDEVTCGLIGRERTDPEGLAQRIKAGLADAIGPHVTCSIGFAPNQLLAKTAAEMDKPDGLVILHPEDLPGRLLDLPLKDIPGIAKGISERLAAAGVSDMAALWALPPKQARAIWNSVEGERFWYALHGYAVGRDDTERRMFGHGRVLPFGWRTPDKAKHCARLLTIKAARRLRREGFEATAFSLSLRYADRPRHSLEHRFAAASDDHTFLRALSRLWTQAFGQTAQHQEAVRIKNIAVMIHGLSAPSGRQFDLFEHTAAPEERRAQARWQQASAVMDALAARHGAKAVSLGPWVEPPGGYAGAKIAFGRVPSFADFDLKTEEVRTIETALDEAKTVSRELTYVPEEVEANV